MQTASHPFEPGQSVLIPVRVIHEQGGRNAFGTARLPGEVIVSAAVPMAVAS